MTDEKKINLDGVTFLQELIFLVFHEWDIGEIMFLFRLPHEITSSTATSPLACDNVVIK